MMKSPRRSSVVTMPPLLLRARDVADTLAISETIVLVFVRRGWLTPIRIPGVRATRFAREEVETLAQKIRSGALAHFVEGDVVTRETA